MTVITMADLRACGVCRRAKAWARLHEIDWESFKKDGIDSDILKAKGDHLAAIRRLEVAAKARGGADV